MMQPHGHPLPDRLRLGGEHAQRRVDAVGRRMQLGIEHHVAALDRVLGDALAGEIERAALARLAAFDRTVLGMDRAHARRQPGRAHDNPSPTATAPESTVPVTTVPAPASVNERSTASRNRPAAARAPMRFGGLEQALAQVVDAFAGDGRDRNDFGAGEAVSPPAIASISAATSRAGARVGEIGLRHRDDAVLDAEQIDDRQMLERLRHDAVVGRDDEEHEVDAGGAGQHVVDEASRGPARRRSRSPRRPAPADRRSRDRW